MLGTSSNMTRVLTKRGKTQHGECHVEIEGHIDTEGRQPDEGGGRGWSSAATNQGSPGASRSWTRHRKEPSGFRGHVAGPTPYFYTSSLQSCEKINVCCLKPCSLRFYYGNARTLIQEECGDGLDPGLGQPQGKTWR